MSVNRERHVPCKCVECVDMAERIEALEAAISDALGRYQVTHIHAGLREALDA